MTYLHFISKLWWYSVYQFSVQLWTQMMLQSRKKENGTLQTICAIHFIHEQDTLIKFLYVLLCIQREIIFQALFDSN